MGAATVHEDRLILKASPLAGSSGSSRAAKPSANPQPFFRQPDLNVASGPNFPEDKKYSFGRETGFRLLPWSMQDRYDRELIDMEFPSVVMENEYLKAEIIPALGGRLWSLFDKKENRDILYRNPVFRPANLAIRDAWFSGGIEWNIGRLGHTVHTCSPVFSGLLKTGNLTILRLWEFERQTRLFWRIEFALPDDSAVLYTYTRIENPDDNTKPLYWWTNAAIPQSSGVRVFSASDEVIYIVPSGGKVKTMDYGCLPDLPVLPGKDASYPALSDYSNEYFFQNDRVMRTPQGPLPWEAAVYEDGYSYGEMSTPPLIYRKMFCWGSGPGGRRWQDFLSLPGQGYLEVQAGLAPTQLHTADISGNETVDWVQAFTAFRAEGKNAFQKDYRSASAYVAERLTEQINPALIQAALEQGRLRSGMEAEIISMGSGWGALEGKLRKSPQGLNFPDESISADEAPWAELLQTGALPLSEEQPGTFVIDEKWEALLKKSPAREGDWLTPYHLGIIAFERGETETAKTFWKESLARKENPWACRNLALASIAKGDTQRALGYYRRALSLPGSEDRSFAEEYIPLLFSTGKEGEAEAELDNYTRRSGSKAIETLSTPLLETAARIALNRGNNALLDKIFSIEQAHIREGNNVFTELWTEREIRRLCARAVPRAQAEEQVQKALSLGQLTPPREIDFRMYTAPLPKLKF